MDDKILFVDDDQRLLDGIRRRLRKRFAIDTAVGPERGLEALMSRGPYAVVVADMNMPGMDGASFLKRARELCPDVVPMMLTGNADIDTATRSVNLGNVFRFMTKPCATDEIESFLRAGVQQHRLHAAERRAAAAEEANRAKSNFLATVSHELRTPLTVVQSTAELLAHFANDEAPEVRAEFIDTILQQSRHLNAMIGQLLQMAELDGGMSACDLQRLDVAELLSEVVEKARGDERCPLVLCVEEPDRPAPCRADAAMLRQVFEQLIDNARKFSPAGETVRVELERAREGYRISVHDLGPGVPSVLASRVFEPFVQREQVLTDKPPGLGLGLAIARRIVALHGGAIGYRADAGGGARFTVELPAAGS